MNEEKLFTLKPKFIPFKNLIINFVIGLPTSLYIGLMFSTLIVKTPNEMMPLALNIGAIIFIIWLIIGFYNEKLNYKYTEYEIFENRIEFTEGFINSQNTTLMLKDIKEIHLKRSFLQKFWDLGTVRFVTAANASNSSRSGLFATGVNFRDIKDSKTIYAKLKTINSGKEE